ncbi:MAG TPA: isochorismatase family protein [Polyangia bacterium]|jgi:isochorismate hydrolase
MKAAGAQALTIDRAEAGLVLVDIQVKLAAAMPKPIFDRALRNLIALTEMAGRLKLPVAVSEQYPQGLGRVLPVLKEAVDKVLPPARYLEKLDFSCCEAPLFDQFLGGGRKTWIVCGMECHICVYQTVRGLLARGFKVHVPVDAVVSRQKHNWKVGLGLMERAGAVITSTETVLFDLIGRASGEEFRALSRLIK